MMENEPFGLRRLARRPLPLDDPAVDRLSPEERSAVGTMWAKRAGAELRVAAALAAIASDLLTIGADPQVLAIVSRAPGDEVRHAEICRRTASRYLGTSVPWPAPAAPALPFHEGAGPTLRCALHMIGQSCLNETIASAYLQASLAAAEAALAKAALGELLSDEIDHARVGWAFLASAAISDEVREQVRPRFGPLRDATIRLWLSQNRSERLEGVPGHGLLADGAVERVVVDAVDKVVVPGLVGVGIAVR